MNYNFDFEFREGEKLEKNIFIEDGITTGDFMSANIEGAAILELLHGTNHIYKIGETPKNPNLPEIYFFKGDYSSEETVNFLENLLEEREIGIVAYNLEGERIEDMLDRLHERYIWCHTLREEYVLGKHLAEVGAIQFKKYPDTMFNVNSKGEVDCFEEFKEIYMLTGEQKEALTIPYVVEAPLEKNFFDYEKTNNE